MSIQRWTVVDTYPDGGGAWVTYDDHVAAVAEEQAQRGVVYRTGLALGRAEALQDAREAVAAAPAYYCEDQWSGADTHRLLSEALAAIDALKRDAERDRWLEDEADRLRKGE